MFFNLLGALSRLTLKLGGWTLEGKRPPEKKYICLASPHTSLVDGFWMVLSAFGLGIRISYLVKDVYTRGIFGRLVLWTGGIPVRSGAGANKVAEVANFINSKDSVEILVAPAGTRAQRDSWRSGFYHIAKGTNIPVYFAYLDFKQRCCGINDRPLYLSDDPVKDMDTVRNFYSGMMGKHPEKMTKIYIKEEKS